MKLNIHKKLRKKMISDMILVVAIMLTIKFLSLGLPIEEQLQFILVSNILVMFGMPIDILIELKFNKDL